MRCCDSCKYLGDREWRDLPAVGDIPKIQVRQGYCYAIPPTAHSRTQSQYPPVMLYQRCGVHTFGWRGFWRAVKRLLTREKIIDANPPGK